MDGNYKIKKDYFACTQAYIFEDFIIMDIKNNNNYHDQQNIGNIQKMRAVLDTLPHFCKQFFRGITEYTSARKIGRAHV